MKTAIFLLLSLLASSRWFGTAQAANNPLYNYPLVGSLASNDLFTVAIATGGSNQLKTITRDSLASTIAASPAMTGAFLAPTGNGVGLTNIDGGRTDASDFPSASAAFNQWTNRGGSLYLPTGPVTFSSPYTFNFLGSTTPDSLPGMILRGNNFGASQLRWTGANDTMLKWTTGATVGIALEDVELIQGFAATGTNTGYGEASITAGGVGPLFWKNVDLQNWNVGAVVYNSGSFFYGLDMNACGIGLNLAALSDDAIVHSRSFGSTNAAIVAQSRGGQFYVDSAGEQQGLVITSGGGNFIQAAAESISNAVVAIGQPNPFVFPPQSIVLTPGPIGGNHVGWGYMIAGASNINSAGLPAYVKLWAPSTALQVEDAIITGLGVVSETNTADTTSVTFDGVTTSLAPMTFSDGSALPALPANTHVGVNNADQEYNLAKLVYSRDTNGVVTASQIIGQNTNATVTTSYAVNYGVQFQSVTVQSNLTITANNTGIANSTNGLSVDLLLIGFNNSTNYSLSFPSSWQWYNANTNAVAPTNLPADVNLNVELKVMGQTVIAQATYANFVFDPDALTFLTSLSSATIQQSNALNRLVVNLKNFNLWTNHAEVGYPLIGVTSNDFGKNLFKPSSFAVTWNVPASFTFNSTGVVGNGTTTYGDTGWNAASNAVNATQNSISYWAYSKSTNLNSGSSLMGTWTGPGGTNPQATLHFDNASIGIFGQLNCGFTGNSLDVGTDGFLGCSRTVSTTSVLYRNLSLHTNGNADTSTGIANGKVALFADNGFPLENFSTFNSAGFFIYDGLSSTQESNLYTAVLQFETDLGRQ